jgi:hypothetical protein
MILGDAVLRLGVYLLACVVPALQMRGDNM